MQRFPLVRLLFAGLCFALILAGLPAPASAAGLAQAAVFPAQGTVNTSANLRAGPGVTFAKMGSLKAGSKVEIVGCNDACNWYHTKSNQWISSSLVDLGETEPAVAPTGTQSPAVPKATASSKANLRSGPGQQYGVVGRVSSGQALDLVGRNSTSSWLQLADGSWIAATLVKNAPRNLPLKEPAAVQGVGKSRAELQSVYEYIGFNFVSSPTSDGQQRVIADKNTTIVELIGPSEEVTEASILTVIPGDDPDEVSNIVVYVLLLPATLLPEWDASPWLTSHMKESASDADGSYRATTVVDGKLVTFAVDRTIATMMLSIEPVE